MHRYTGRCNISGPIHSKFAFKISFSQFIMQRIKTSNKIKIVKLKLMKYAKYPYYHISLILYPKK